MLELRPVCELCSKKLPPESQEAMICTFECTFCASCVSEQLKNICPNCGGGFMPRPVRPKAMLSKYPATTKEIVKSIHKGNYQAHIDQYKDVEPHNR